jgi:hypothetical protein
MYGNLSKSEFEALGPEEKREVLGPVDVPTLKLECLELV